MSFLTPPHVPTRQGLNCPTFRRPPLDGTLAVPQFVEYNAVHSPQHRAFVFLKDDGSLQTIRYPELWRMIRRAAHIVRGHVGLASDQYAAQNRPPGQAETLAILASADTITYYCLVVATMRLGFVPFPISVRNSARAVASLIKDAHAIQVFVSPDSAMQALIREANDVLDSEVSILDLIQFDDIADDSHRRDDPVEVELPVHFDLDNVAVLCHTSGSSSFPKPVAFKHRALLRIAMCFDFGEVDVCDQVFGVHSSPFFHALGIVSVCWSSPGVVCGVFPPSRVPLAPTPERLLHHLIGTKTDVVVCVPASIEAWARNPSNNSTLKSFRYIIYAGGPLSKSLGDELVRSGTALISAYGCTEVCNINLTVPSTVSIDEWEYFRFSPQHVIELLPQEGPGMEDIFEVVVVNHEYYATNVVNGTSADGRPAYLTRDLVQHHPNNPELWRIYGRADDQLVHVNGEKTNPVPLESILMQDPRIAVAIIFGHGRPYNGVLIEPSFTFDPSDEDELVRFKDSIRPSLDRVNDFAPAHSRLFQEMILVTKVSKPVERTAKGTARRRPAMQLYDEEISGLYTSFAESTQPNIPLPLHSDEQGSLHFVREVVRRVMRVMPDDNEDIFGRGCDSLQATYIRNAIVRAMRVTIPMNPQDIPSDMVYTHPTIASLATAITTNSYGAQSEAVVRGDGVQTMLAMRDKYCTGLVGPHAHDASAEAPSKFDEVVAITGTTGRLGCHILLQLLARPSVSRVYALNRGGLSTAHRRQEEAFERWNLEKGVLKTDKLLLLDSDISRPHLGITKEKYDEIKKTVTSVIHTAWQVNFRLPLSAFEQLLAGLQNLINLTLASPHPSPPTILYTSSISVVGNGLPSRSPVAETPITDPKVSVGIGYAESKWVAESILLHAANVHNARVTIVRVGQLCGDTVRGGWNDREWVPAIVRSAQILSMIPSRNDGISWLPVDIAASALLEMVGSTELILHLVHPLPVDWKVFSDTCSDILKIRSAPYPDWLDVLQKAKIESVDSDRAITDNPALHLVDFFNSYTEGAQLDVQRAVRVSPSLASAGRLETKDVEAWIGYWKSTGFLT